MPLTICRSTAGHQSQSARRPKRCISHESESGLMGLATSKPQKQEKISTVVSGRSGKEYDWRPVHLLVPLEARATRWCLRGIGVAIAATTATFRPLSGKVRLSTRVLWYWPVDNVNMISTMPWAIAGFRSKDQNRHSILDQELRLRISQVLHTFYVNARMWADMGVVLVTAVARDSRSRGLLRFLRRFLWIPAMDISRRT